MGINIDVARERHDARLLDEWNGEDEDGEEEWAELSSQKKKRIEPKDTSSSSDPDHV